MYIKKLNIKYGDMQIKQYSMVKYLGRLIVETMSGKAMTLNVIHNIIKKLKFRYRKNDFLTLVLRRLLCNHSHKKRIVWKHGPS